MRGERFGLTGIVLLFTCLPWTVYSQELIWQRQVHAYLDGSEMAFYHGGLDYSKPVVADLDGDGDGDLYVGEHDGFLNVFENLGGNPPNWQCVTTALDSIDVGKHNAPAFWDIDIDGDLDLFIGNEEGRLWYFRNDGTALTPALTFQTDYYDSIDVSFHAIPFFADLDTDGDDDLLIANNSGGAAHFKNYGSPGNPTFRLEANYYQGIDLGMKSTVCVFDFDADNLNDLIMSSLEGHIVYYNNQGPPTNPTYRDMGAIASVPHNGTPTLWDLDGDGDLDLISGESDGNLNMWTNIGSPSSPELASATGNLAYLDLGMDTKPVLGDLDSDGDMDLLLGRHRWGMCYLENVGEADSAAWILRDENYTGLNPGGTDSPALQDLDADGDLDLVIGLENGTLLYRKNIGSAAAPLWDAPVYNYASVDVGTRAAPAFADIDGDTDFDMFIGSQTGTVKYMRNNGNPTNPIWQDLGNFPGMDVGFNSQPAFNDLDGDGDFDLIIGNGNLQGWLTYYRNDGSPYLYSWASALQPFQGWEFGDNASPCFGDLDDNDHADLLVGCYAGGLWLLNNLGPLHDVDITLTPYDPPIQVPAMGGTFDFAITIEVGDSPFAGAVWCDVTMPDGATFGPTVGPVTVNLPAGATISRDRTQGVLNTAPPGMYSMNGYAGLYPDSIWAQDSFPFEKLSSGNGPEIGSWFNYGESFAAWAMTSATQDGLPTASLLAQNHPNPFNPTTSISYKLQAASYVSLKVYDTAGRLVANLVQGWRDAGSHEVTFDGSNLPSGVYVYRITAGDLQASGKMVLMK